jgi:hypothetical protein
MEPEKSDYEVEGEGDLHLHLRSGFGAGFVKDWSLAACEG